MIPLKLNNDHRIKLTQTPKRMLNLKTNVHA